MYTQDMASIRPLKEQMQHCCIAFPISNILLFYHSSSIIPSILLFKVQPSIHNVERENENTLICMCNDQLNNYGILTTSYWWEIRRGDCFETGLLSDQSSRLTVPQSQWTTHLNTSVTLNRLTSANPRHLSMSLHSPEKKL